MGYRSHVSVQRTVRTHSVLAHSEMVWAGGHCCGSLGQSLIVKKGQLVDLKHVIVGLRKRTTSTSAGHNGAVGEDTEEQ